MSLMSRASGRKRYLWTAFRPTQAGGDLLRWVVKGTQIPPPLHPYGKQKEQSPGCVSPAQGVSVTHLLPQLSSLSTQIPSHRFHGQGNASPKQAAVRAALMPRSLCSPAPRAAPGTAGVSDATVVPHPPASSSTHPSPYLPDPQLPAALGTGY